MNWLKGEYVSKVENQPNGSQFQDYLLHLIFILIYLNIYVVLWLCVSIKKYQEILLIVNSINLLMIGDRLNYAKMQ